MDSKRNSPAQSVRPSRLQIWLVCIALAAATLAVYAQVVRFQFVTWDDPGYVYDNPHIAQGVTMPSLAWAFSSAHASNWHPVTWISHMVDVQLFGLERGPGEGALQGPGGHHLVSVLLHTANSLLLLWLLTRMTGAFWPSALTAALFAIHPLRVESVAWVSERKDVLSGLFFILTLLAYHAYAQRPTLRRYSFVFIALALGLMGKPMLVTVPFLLLLLDLWPLRRWELPKLPPRRILLEKLPLLGLVLASCLVTMHVQQAAGAVSTLDGLPLAWRLVNAPVATLMYLFKTIWPTQLASIYPHPADAPDARLGQWVLFGIGATLFLAFISLVVLFKARSRPHLLVGWFWFLGMLVPVIGLMQVGNQAWADRYAYLPLVGIYLAVNWSLAQCVHQRPALRRTVSVAVLALLLALVPLTWRQVAVWRDSRSLYEHALAVTRDNYMAHNNWGGILQEMGQFEDAVVQHREALRIKPRFAKAHNNWGMALEALGHPGQAIGHYQQAVQIKPEYAEAYNNWGNALQTLGSLDEALAHYKEALRIRPGYVKVYNNLGVVYAGKRQLADALQYFEQAIRLKPDYTDAEDNLRKVREMIEENSKLE
jgi:tetratricopeptide (TPR) repeat protein